MKQPKVSLTKLDNNALSIINEVANIVGGTFLSVVSNRAGISLVQSVPEFLVSTMKKVIDTIIDKLNPKDKGLSIAIEVDFQLSTTTIITHYIFLLEVTFAQKLLEALEKSRK